MSKTEFSARQIEIMEAATKRIHQHGIQKLTIKNLAFDLNLSEAALYRHFKSKDEILFMLLNYFIVDMYDQVETILNDKEKHPSEYLNKIFVTQLETFVKNPSIVSILFSEGIFHFNVELQELVTGMMEKMHNYISGIISEGQKENYYGKLLSSGQLATIIMGSMRMVVLKWKLSGHNSDIVQNGTKILNGLLKMIEK